MIKIVRAADDDGHVGIFQQGLLAPEIILHSGVLMGGDVVRPDVQEDAVAEMLTVGAMHLVGLAADLGGDDGQLMCPGLGEELLHLQRFRGGEMGGDYLAAHVVLHTGEQTGLLPGDGLHDGVGHIGGGGFALGAGDAHQGEGVRGVVVEPLGCQALGLAHVTDQQGGERAVRLHLLGHVAHGAGLLRFEQVFGLEAVALADEQVSGLD